MFSVRDFGARGDGRTLDTAAIQAAIDAAAATGGGKVVLPPGVYRSGTLRLADRLTLHLATGAVLAASGDIADYREDSEALPQSLHHYLLEGRGVNHLVVEGGGCIEGSGDAFWEKELLSGAAVESLPSEPEPLRYEVFKPRPVRPCLLYLRDCTDVTLRDFSITNAPAYTIWLLGCEQICIRGLTVRNSRFGPNTDVLDIDCCRRVRISDCDLEAGDDCIALKSDIFRLGRPAVCEDVVVTNCVLSSATCAVRIGYEGDGPIRDCVFSNLAIRDARHGIDLVSILPVVHFTRIDSGAVIERILFSDIVMRNVGQALFIWAGREAPRTGGYRGHISDLMFRNIIADSVATSYIGSRDDCAVRRLSLGDVVLQVRSAAPDMPPDADCRAVPSHWGGNWKSGVLALRRIDDICLNNVRLSQESGPHPALHWTAVENLSIDGAPQSGNGPET